MNASYCSICLDNKPCSTRFSDLDENNTNWLTKLKSLVPDLDELEDSLICYKCTKQVDDFLNFREKIQNLVKRQKEVGHESDSDTFNDEIYSQRPIEFNENTNDSCHGSDTAYETTRVAERISIKPKHDTLSLGTAAVPDIECKPEECDVHSCLICGKELESQKDLKIHKKICSKSIKPTFTCYTCNKTYTSKTNLKLHHKKCGKEIEKLKQNLKEEKILKKRGRKSTRSYSCETCEQIFNLVKDLVAHSKTVHSIEEKLVKPYSCNQCVQRFRTYAGYDQHLKYHSRNRDNVCSLCGKRFITKSELIVHEYTHFNRRNYKCTICDKAFNTNKNLKTHILVVHTDRAAWKYGCTICEKRFPQKGNYDQHMKRHAGDKQHICHICQKPFITSSELKRHVNLHSNVKAFTCEFCQREYKTQRTLKTHLRRSHSVGDKLPEKEKKFVCHICPSQFYDKQKLSRHLYCHSGVKPFQCTACDKKFADKSYLKHHMKVAHNVFYMAEDVKYETFSDLKYEVPNQLKFDYEGVK